MNAKLLCSSAVVMFLAVAAGGCSSATRVAAREPSVTVNQTDRTPTASVLHVDDEIARVCNLPTPHFDFDSSKVRETADPRLDKIADCFTRGPLAGRKMNLVGHADPRGETEYNFALGQRRAGSVAGYIESRGVRPSQVATTSRGELDAIGTDDEGWARDRRVDMALAN